MEKDDPMPIVCIKSEESGITYFPKFVKNVQGDWELADKSFRKLFMRYAVLEKPANKEDE